MIARDDEYPLRTSCCHSKLFLTQSNIHCFEGIFQPSFSASWSSTATQAPLPELSGISDSQGYTEVFFSTFLAFLMANFTCLPRNYRGNNRKDFLPTA